VRRRIEGSSSATVEVRPVPKVGVVRPSRRWMVRIVNRDSDCKRSRPNPRSRMDVWPRRELALINGVEAGRT